MDIFTRLLRFIGVRVSGPDSPSGSVVSGARAAHGTNKSHPIWLRKNSTNQESRFFRPSRTLFGPRHLDQSPALLVTFGVRNFVKLSQNLRGEARNYARKFPMGPKRNSHQGLIRMTIKQRGIRGDRCGPDAMEIARSFRKPDMQIPLRGSRFWDRPRKCKQGLTTSRPADRFRPGFA